MTVRRRAAFLAACCALGVAGCGLAHAQGLSFRVDNRLHLTAPADLKSVNQPVSVSWAITGFRVAGGGTERPSRQAGYFGVFVDRAPIAPGQTMRAVASGDHICLSDPQCPGADYLAARHVFTTTTPTVTLPRLPDVPGDAEPVQVHRVIVVLIDTGGHRIGESAWELDLRLPQAGSA